MWTSALLAHLFPQLQQAPTPVPYVLVLVLVLVLMLVLVMVMGSPRARRSNLCEDGSGEDLS